MDDPEVMGPCCLISEEEVAAAIKELNIGKAAVPTGVASDMNDEDGWLIGEIACLAKD